MSNPQDNQESSWKDDFHDFTRLFRGEEGILPWVKWSALFLAFAAAVVVGGLLLTQSLNSSAGPTPTPTAVVSETPAPTASATAEPTPAPVPMLSQELISTIPTAWRSISREGCAQAWTGSSDGVSSIVVLDRATKAFKASGFTSSSSWGESDLTITASGNQNGITDAELVFTTASIELCLR